jgi:ABC-type branched-subunit amino acid transport system substrate-binding protein
MVDPWPVSVSLNKDRTFVSTWGSGVLEYSIATDRWTSRRRNETESVEPNARSSELILNFATGSAYDSDSEVLWTATRGGLIRQDGHTWSRYTSENSGLSSNFINSLLLHDNKLWLCTKRGLSVFNLKTSAWSAYHISDLPPNEEIPVVKKGGVQRENTLGQSPSESNVRAIAFHRTDIWVASDDGLSVGTPSSTGYLGKPSLEIGTPGQVGDPRRRPALSSSSAYKPNQTVVNIGFFGPVEGSPEVPNGFEMLHGAQLAVDEANDRLESLGGAHTTRFKYELKIHNDSAPWGASTTEPVKMALDEHIVAILGSIDGSPTHTLVRVATELGVPVMNTATTDPSVAQTGAPGLVLLMPDDRQQSRALVRYIVGQRSIRKVGVLREDARYARLGAVVFKDEAERTGQLSAIEATFQSGDTDFSTQLRQLRDSKIDGLVIWCRPAEGALILKQMRSTGLQIPVLGPSYLVSPQLIESAGTASEGFVATSVLNPTGTSKRWQDFEKNYQNRFGEYPDAYASYSYDGVNLLIAAIEKVGPNRETIAEALLQRRLGSYEGASGQLSFDGNLNNVAPLAMARVEAGKFVYWVPKTVR